MIHLYSMYKILQINLNIINFNISSAKTHSTRKYLFKIINEYTSKFKNVCITENIDQFTSFYLLIYILYNYIH